MQIKCHSELVSEFCDLVTLLTPKVKEEKK